MAKKKVYTVNQIGALISLLIIAIWGSWVIWTHLNKPWGMEWTEILFLSVLVPAYLVLLPLYLLRLRWSYIGGVIALLGLFIGAVKSILDKTYFFSFSAFNLMTLVIFISLFLCIYFSIRSFVERESTHWTWNTAGIIFLVVIPVLTVNYVSQNRQDIENDQLRQVIQGVQNRTKHIESLEEKIKALMAEGDIPSLTTAIVVNGRIAWVKGFGEHKDTELIYDMGSIGKTFTATALLQLYERELVDLDDDVNDYLPFTVRHPLYPDIPITLHMLLSHQSCLGHNTELYYAYMMGPELRQWGIANRGWEFYPGFSALSFSDFMSGYIAPDGAYFQPGNWLQCKPGSTYSYSTPGFDILGFVVENVSGMSFNKYLKVNIFDPLQMTKTTATPLNSPELIATPYERWYGVLAKTNVELPLSQRRRVGGGGIYTSVTDLAKYLLMHMNEGRINDIQLLKTETVAKMHQSTIEATGDFMQTGYGYGWGRFQVSPRQMWDITYQPRGYQGHGGRYWGYSSAMYMVDTQQDAYGYALLMNISMVENMDYPWVFAIQNNIQDLILQQAYALSQTASNDN